MSDQNENPPIDNGRDEVFSPAPSSGFEPRPAPAAEAPAPAPEPVAAEAPVTPAAPAADDSAIRITALEGELKESRERLLRVAADFENFKKRNERERQEYLKFATERLLRELLPVMDNLARAADSARRAGDAPSIVSGVDLVIQEFGKVLRRAGVEPVEAEGKPFDPAVHEALQQVESEAVPPGTVVAEVQRGYTLHGRVLRPALVSVAAAPEVTHPGMCRDDLE